MQGQEKDTDEMLFADTLDRACRGEKDARSRVLASSEPHIRTLVGRMLSPARFLSDGEDVLQTVRLELIKALGSLRARTSGAFHAWLERLVRCRVLDWQKACRKARRIPTKAQISLQRTDVPEPCAAAASPSRMLMNREQRAQLARAIDLVPERYRAVLHLIQAEEPTLKELAAFLGKGPDAARKFVGRALAHLKATLGGARLCRTSSGAYSVGTDVHLRN